MSNVGTSLHCLLSLRRVRTTWSIVTLVKFLPELGDNFSTGSVGGRSMDEKLGSPDSSGHPREHAARRRSVRGFTVLLWGTVAIAASAIVAATFEARTSYVQSRLFSGIAKTLTYDVKPGPSDNIAFPRGGPDDKRK